jgi:hypothetical protein
MRLGNVIPPFRKNFDKIFVFSLSASPPLFLILGIALLSVLIHCEGMFFDLLRFSVWGLMLTNVFEAVKHTAQGHFKPPRNNGGVLYIWRVCLPARIQWVRFCGKQSTTTSTTDLMMTSS